MNLNLNEYLIMFPEGPETMTEKTKVKLDKVKRAEKKKGGAGELTDEEREAVTIVFHQFETGLREGTIFTKVRND